SPFAGGNVSSDGCGTDNPACAIFERRNAHGHVDPLTILALANRFVMFDSLTVFKALHDRGHFILLLGRDEEGDVSAYDLFRCVAVDGLRASVPTGNDAIQGLGKDRVLG